MAMVAFHVVCGIARLQSQALPRKLPSIVRLAPARSFQLRMIGCAAGDQDTAAARQAVRLYLPGSRLRLLRPPAFADGVAPVLGRLRDLFAAPNYADLYGQDDVVVQSHRLLLRQPRIPIVWLDLGDLTRRAVAEGGGNRNSATDTFDQWIASTVERSIGGNVEHLPEQTSDGRVRNHFDTHHNNDDHPASRFRFGHLNERQRRLVDVIEQIRSHTPRASQVRVHVLELNCRMNVDETAAEVHL